MSISLSRRHLLASLPATLLAAAPGGRIRFGCQTNSWPIDPKKADSFAAVLARLKGFQFQGFETSFRNVQEHFDKPAEVKRVIDQSGLKFLAVHIFLQEYDPQTLVAPADLYRRVVDGSAPLGAERLILSGATAAPNGKLDAAALKRKCAAINEAARYAKKKGLGFAYHNHGAEFASGAAEMNGLLAGTDPKLVQFMFDSGHARRQKTDPAAFLIKHGKRIAGVHLRDLSDRPGDNPELGPFPLHALHMAILKSKWSGWLIVEEENAVNKSGDDAVRPAREALRKEFKA